MKCTFQSTDSATEQFVSEGFDTAPFFVLSTSVKRPRVINLKTVSVVLLCCVLYVEIYTEQRAFVDGINFLFSFEEKCCGITLIISRSLW